MDNTMDNQQETEKAWIAGIMDGEGCFAIYKYTSTNHIKGDISVSNTNHFILRRFIKFLQNNQINYYVRTYKKIQGRKYLYHIQITRLKDKKRFIELIMPYMSKQEIYIIKELIDYCVDNFNDKRRNRDKFGRFNSDLAQKPFELLNKYKAFKDSSETLCQSPISLG